MTIVTMCLKTMGSGSLVRWIPIRFPGAWPRQDGSGEQARENGRQDDFFERSALRGSVRWFPGRLADEHPAWDDNCDGHQDGEVTVKIREGIHRGHGLMASRSGRTSL